MDRQSSPPIGALQVGAGQVLLFATNPVYRWQNFGEYRMLYNALFNYKDLRLGIDTNTKPDVDALWEAEEAESAKP